MIKIYCSNHHQNTTKNDGLCESCYSFQCYVKQRLDRCPYGVENPTLLVNTCHCYKPEAKRL
ncbi:nitrous oxide-stimulated promoter family protein [Photobacterium leiognathi]|uniref:nitrous oxide-stimulated promoter family protein n=1 Tax=Photobacterium leiognathi TaxID=553611 RepID=UPI002733B697|nr:nitrous oxide-stimulated promoter family protein [Photobacterium leiognathi]